jgi:hypothetical protein
MALTKPLIKEGNCDLNHLKSEPTIKPPTSHDDDNLIRETQAALKSLSGGLANARNRLTEQQFESVGDFQNLFDPTRMVQQHSAACGAYDSAVTIKTEKVDVEGASSPEQCSDYNRHQYKNSLDFNELVHDESSNEGEGVKRGLKRKSPFSQHSAFKPPDREDKKGNFGNYPTYENYDDVEGDATAALNGTESFAKSMDSPDSKQYTILQPAGVGSRAASVMKDIAREGVVSVSAVSSTSSPGLDQNRVTSTTASTAASNFCDKLFSPQYSPGKGEMF